jgi:hypothetical protein
MSREDAMSRMVDDLVNLEDDGYATHHEANSIAPTPPEQTFEDTATGGNGSFSPAPVTAQQLVEKFSLTPSRPSPTSRKRPDFSTTPAMSSPPVVASLPRLPNQSDIWAPQAASSSPLIPPGHAAHQSFDNRLVGDHQSSPAIHQHTAYGENLAGQTSHSRGHSRATSLVTPSNRSTRPANPDTWSTLEVTPIVNDNAHEQLQNRYANGWNVPPGFVQHGFAGGRPGSFTYGAVSGHPNHIQSAWNGAGDAGYQSSPLGGWLNTPPPNGQGGSPDPRSGASPWMNTPSHHGRNNSQHMPINGMKGYPRQAG